MRLAPLQLKVVSSSRVSWDIADTTVVAAIIRRRGWNVFSVQKGLADVNRILKINSVIELENNT